MAFLRLGWRQIAGHKLRTLLTIGSIVVAVFLLCALRSLITTLQAPAAVSSAKRLVTQSAVSLFVALPTSYQSKINAVEGVESTLKWNWFGGSFRDQRNFFAQFAVEPEQMFATYPEIDVIEGSAEGFSGRRDACMIGKTLASTYDWKVGDTVPILGNLYPHPDGAEVAWAFYVAAIYDSSSASFDKNQLFFHWDLFEKTLESAGGQSPPVSVFVVQVAPGADRERVIAQIDAIFDGGPQRTSTTTEAAFQAQFVSMFGSIPVFLSWIGGAVLLAILLACVNTMLMAGREQTHDIGILKALGFDDRAVFLLMVLQGLLIGLLGGALGLALAIGTETSIATAIGAQFPNFVILPSTKIAALVAAIGVGVLAGLVPAWNALRLRPVEALRAEN